jgi:hypothetical protein
VLLAVFNDGAMIALSKDRVVPSPTPNIWRLRNIFITGLSIRSALHRPPSQESGACRRRPSGAVASMFRRKSMLLVLLAQQEANSLADCWQSAHMVHY